MARTSAARKKTTRRVKKTVEQAKTVAKQASKVTRKTARQTAGVAVTGAKGARAIGEAIVITGELVKEGAQAVESMARPRSPSRTTTTTKKRRT
jgi:thiamine monophosphate kinase